MDYADFIGLETAFHTEVAVQVNWYFELDVRNEEQFLLSFDIHNLNLLHKVTFSIESSSHNQLVATQCNQAISSTFL
jgi:hypothetical protein